jgi:hypothetical protein
MFLQISMEGTISSDFTKRPSQRRDLSWNKAAGCPSQRRLGDDEERTTSIWGGFVPESERRETTDSLRMAGTNPEGFRGWPAPGCAYYLVDNAAVGTIDRRAGRSKMTRLGRGRQVFGGDRLIKLQSESVASPVTPSSRVPGSGVAVSAPVISNSGPPDAAIRELNR